MEHGPLHPIRHVLAHVDSTDQQEH